MAARPATDAPSRRGAKVREHTELVALRIGQHRPLLAAGQERRAPTHERVGVAVHVDVHAVLRLLGFGDAIEEERRLFYVAITRARDELYLTFPHMRLNAGYGDMFQRPSRFLKEIPTQLVEDWQVRRK